MIDLKKSISAMAFGILMLSALHSHANADDTSNMQLQQASPTAGQMFPPGNLTNNDPTQACPHGAGLTWAGSNASGGTIQCITPPATGSTPLFGAVGSDNGYTAWNATITAAGIWDKTHGRPNDYIWDNKNCTLTSDSDPNIWTITSNMECMREACEAFFGQTPFMAAHGAVVIGSATTAAYIEDNCLYLQP